MNLRQKVAYLQGLAAGLGLDPQGKEGRILTQVIDLLSEMSEALYELKGSHEELESYVEDVDQDLSVVEEDLYGDDEDADAEVVEVKCPNCGTVVHLERLGSGDDDDTLDLICPNCGEMIYDTDDDLDYAGDDDDEATGQTAGTERRPRETGSSDAAAETI
ncbi:MAG: CD1247 N-terminal domain-containing protein [Bacillota bacterium]